MIVFRFSIPTSIPLDIEEAVITANEQRAKTTEQKSREGLRLKWVEQERAKKRQADNARANNPNIKNVESVPPSSENGKSRDIAASKLGISGKQLEKAIDVVSVIDDLESRGSHQKAEDSSQRELNIPSESFSIPNLPTRAGERALAFLQTDKYQVH